MRSFCCTSKETESRSRKPLKSPLKSETLIPEQRFINRTQLPSKIANDFVEFLLHINENKQLEDLCFKLECAPDSKFNIVCWSYEKQQSFQQASLICVDKFEQLE